MTIERRETMLMKLKNYILKPGSRIICVNADEISTASKHARNLLNTEGDEQLSAENIKSARDYLINLKKKHYPLPNSYHLYIENQHLLTILATAIILTANDSIDFAEKMALMAQFAILATSLNYLVYSGYEVSQNIRAWKINDSSSTQDSVYTVKGIFTAMTSSAVISSAIQNLIQSPNYFFKLLNAQNHPKTEIDVSSLLSHDIAKLYKADEILEIYKQIFSEKLLFPEASQNLGVL